MNADIVLPQQRSQLIVRQGISGESLPRIVIFTGHFVALNTNRTDLTFFHTLDKITIQYFLRGLPGPAKVAPHENEDESEHQP